MTRQSTAFVTTPSTSTTKYIATTTSSSSSSSTSAPLTSPLTVPPETSSVRATQIPTTFVDQTKAPSEGLSGGAVFALVASIIVVVIIGALGTLLLLKKQKIVNVKLPLLDPIFFKKDNYSNISLTYKKNESSGIENPNLDT